MKETWHILFGQEKGSVRVNETDFTKLADSLDTALKENREIERLTLTYPTLTLENAYVIQDMGIQKRLFRGEKRVGFKMGLTSEAKRSQMDLNSPVFGVLTDRMHLQDGSKFSLKGTIHPKIEPEIAFVMEKDIVTPLTHKEAIQACSAICSAMEILDSRYLNFKYFSLPDVVADNCSSAYFVISKTWVHPSKIDISNLEMSMSVNGTSVQKASSNAISGHPFNSLVQLSEMLYARNIKLPAGSIILAGAATQAISLEPGIEVQLTIQDLGMTSLRVSI